NDLDEKLVIEKGMTIDFPDSVIEMFEGYLGQPTGGFPVELQNVILKGKTPITVRPGELLEPVNYDTVKEQLQEELKRQVTDIEAISYSLYPKVFMDYEKKAAMFGDLSKLDTATFFYGMKIGEEIEIEIEKGKTLIVKLIAISEPLVDGTRVIYFEMNGQPRTAVVKDENVKSTVASRTKADSSNQSHIGATMPGTVLKVLVNKGDKVRRGDHLMITEAMKMETTVQAPFDGEIGNVHVKNSDTIQPGDLLVELNKI
ncbi:MAG: pycA, partial [Bacillales bacterium]|nr:pycA [Bacillales bacterium]